MTWVRLDDTFVESPLWLRLSFAARSLYIDWLSYSARHLTDGVVPDAIVKRMKGSGYSQGNLRELKDEGLVETHMLSAVFLPRWLEHLRPSDVVLAERKGGAKRKEKSRREKAEKEAAREAAEEAEEMSRRDTARDTNECHGVSHTTPTRPDPVVDVSVLSPLTENRSALLGSRARLSLAAGE